MEALYYTPGKLEWHLRIPVNGRNQLVVSFGGGSFTSHGMVCGSYRTDNEVIQHIIEESREFKSGLICRKK